MPDREGKGLGGSVYLVSMYTAFVVIIGTTTRAMANESVVLGFLQTVINDVTFIACNYVIAHHFVDGRRVVDVKTIASVMVASFGIGIAYFFVIKYGLSEIFDAFAPPPKHPFAPSAIIGYYSIVSLGFGLAYVWMAGIERSAERELAAQQAQSEAESRILQAELRRLRNQIDPHFLFNCLNTAITEVHDRPKRATTVLRELSAYLRYSLDVGDRAFSPLAAEFAALRSFLRIQDTRFGSRLATRLVLDRGARERLVPTLLLQPLIENATKYGIPDDGGVLHVTVEATLEDDVLTITITNTGLLQPLDGEPRSTRIGLANLRSRLDLHYGERASFDLVQEGETVVARLILNGGPV